MTDSDWGRLQRLFDAVLELPEAERTAFLDRECGDDAPLRRKLETLIEADEQNLETDERQPLRKYFKAPESEMVGTTVDGWRILERIGSGGMGKVYLAERADGEFEQRAALKIVKKGMDSEVVLQRFRQERQILARLHHPNIASFLDGGMTADGRPYFAMEFVDGLPITEYCDQHRLSLEKRLALFQKACDAVHHAHKSLIVHRDLKPSNIIVMPDGELKLLDFGIAKLLDDSDADDRLTRTGMQVLTPAYAAPEQLMNSDITTATDVYALGIVLYELLTGRRPFETRRTPRELLDLVLTGDPLKPSAAVLQIPADTDGHVGTQTREQLSAVRGTRTEHLRKLLAGDLDTICLMAMHKEPTHRYTSADHLAADISRHLEGLPVVASPDSLMYRAGKFYTRHRPAVISTIGAITAFIAMSVFYTLQLADERDRARVEADRAAATTQFLVDIFKLSDPDQNAGQTVTAKEILDLGAQKLNQDLESLPATKATLGTTIGTVYESLGLYEEALSQHTYASGLRRETGDLPGLAESLRELGSIQYELGELEAANESLAEALAINKSILPDNHVRIATNLNDLGHITYAQGDYDTAIAIYRSAIAMYEELNDFSDPGYADTLHDLGQVQQLQGDLVAAEKNFRSALDAALDNYGELHSITTTYMHDLAALIHEMDDYEGAEALYLRVIQLDRKLLGDSHPDMEVLMTNLGRLYGDMGRLDEAEVHLREAVEIAVRLRGPRHTFTAYDSINLANLLTTKGETEEARALFEEALDIYAENLDEYHPYIASASVGYAALLNRMQLPDESLMHSQRALDICEASLPAGHWLAASATSVRGESLMLTGDLDQAETMLLEGYAGVAEARPRDRMTKNAVRRLVDFYVARGNPDEAERFRQLMPGD
ncbi:MAG: serine/threonine-protein kinase [Pseudomonadota bacterium]